MNFAKIKKIPTLIGLTIIIFGLAISIFLVQKSQNIFLKAKTSLAPKQIKITNVTDNSLTVSWFTSQPTNGLVKFGASPESLDSKAYDERNLALGKEGLYLTHYVTLNNLEASTTYYFEILSDSQKYNHNGKPYQETTGPKLKGSSPTNDLAYGLVTDPRGLALEEAIVYLNMANSSLQSCLVSSSGNWAIPLNLIRTSDLANYLSYDPDASTVEIFVQATEQTASAVTTTSNDSPVPTIIIGESLDFRKKDSDEKKEASLESGFSLQEETAATPSFSLSIINPQEKETLATQKPEFFGKGPTGKKITIEVHSPQFTDEIISNEWGDWTWSPPENLEPGEHQITVSYLNDEGDQNWLSRNFIILAAEENDLPSFTATPSASPTEEPSLTPTPEVTPTGIISSPTPSPEVTATPTASPSPTITPTLDLSPTATPSTPAVPPTEAGILTPTLVVFITGIILLTSGLLISVP